MYHYAQLVPIFVQTVTLWSGSSHRAEAYDVLRCVPGTYKQPVCTASLELLTITYCWVKQAQGIMHIPQSHSQVMVRGSKHVWF